MKILCVIPSRMGSTRLPRKPLLPIQGKPMVQWTYEHAAQCDFFTDVIVATDSEEIISVIENIGGKALLTDKELETGSDRVASVAKHFPEIDIVVNLQGDEPFVKPAMLKRLVAPFLNGEKLPMSTLASPLDRRQKHSDPGVVKVITDQMGNALYFSRAPIPYFRTEADVPVFHHIGLYAFTRDFLSYYTTLPKTPLELAESLEQLRVLEHGHKIRVCLTPERTLEINTPEEYEQAQSFNYVS